MRVADDDAAQLCGRGLGGTVVEDHALGADVVVDKLVVRQTTAIGCGDVDDRYAIAGMVQRGPWRGDHNAIRLRPHRLPEHDVGQQERQATLGHAPETFAAIHPRGRLTSEEGKLANVHVGNLVQQ
ncbi:hypothetical protein D9M68_910590 [compost metagenome]